jgi:RecB family exonuclease
VRPLPPPVDRVVVPEFFSPSQLAHGETCFLRVALGSDELAPTLRTHPAAEIGRLSHRLLERAVRGDIERRGTPEEDLARAFDELVEQTRNQLLADPETAAFADLPSTMSPLDWRKKRRAVLDVAAELYRLSWGSLSPGRPKGGRMPSFVDVPSGRDWAEVQIEVPELRLKGRMDVVRKEQGRVTIKDLKTGRVFDDEGNVLEHIERQLRLYALAVHRLASGANVRILVDDGAEHEVAFGEDIAHETETWLSGLLDRLPAGTELASTELADVGECCRWCPYRHACPIYLAAAPELWQQQDVSFALPLDIWGEVRSIAVSGPKADLELEDAAGRRVKVFGVDARRIRTVTEGDLLWFFGLRARMGRSAGGEWHHPLNFYESSPDVGPDRAWSLEVFRAPA